jgi:hypothetical protein
MSSDLGGMGLPTKIGVLFATQFLFFGGKKFRKAKSITLGSTPLM